MFNVLFFLFFLIDLYRHIIASQYHVSFCCIQSESAICIHMSPNPLPFEPPPHPPYPTPLGHLKTRSQSPCAMLLLPTSQLFYIQQCIYVHATLTSPSFRFHIYALAYSICFSLSDLLHSVCKKLETINAGKGVVKREPPYTVSGNVN